MPSLPVEDTLRQYAPFIRAYANTLESGEAAAKDWQGRLNCSDESQVESAIGEALAWNVLASRLPYVRSLNAGTDNVRTPDFECERQDGSIFYVEVKTLTTEAVSNWTGLQDYESPSFSPLRSWSSRLKRVLCKGAGQGGEREVPLVLFFATLHQKASAFLCDRHEVEELLHSRSFISSPFDPSTGEGGPAAITVNFEHAAFTTAELEPIRRSISAFILGGFGVVSSTGSTPPIVGGLNPDALHVFDPTCLADIPFGRFRNWPIPDDSTAKVEFDWIQMPG